MSPNVSASIHEAVIDFKAQLVNKRAELLGDLAQIDEILGSLNGGPVSVESRARAGGAAARSIATNRASKPSMSPAARAAISKRMKAVWRERRRASSR